MSLYEKTREISKLYDIHPSRSKGQNFLVNEDVYDQVVEAADLKAADTVLEVGPGLGFLTAKLAKKAGRVVSVELDDKLAAFLSDAITDSGAENVEILNGNILDFKIPNPSLPGAGYKIAANLPYNITSVFLRKFLTHEHKPELMVLLLQKEVAQRICAKPGDMSLLALSVQFYAEPEIVGYVGRKDFWPSPEVDSAIIKIRIRKEKREVDEKEFFRLAKFGFSSKRKMLKNNLAGGLHIAHEEAEAKLAKAGLGLKVRAEDLGVEDWIKLIRVS